MNLTNEECYAVWAPDDSPWSLWAKPVLFTRLDVDGTQQCDADFKPGEAPPLPPFAPDLAIIVDLPADDAVRAGFLLARAGWWPVPLFNATNGPKPLVNVVPCASLLRAGAEILQRCDRKPDAPPAFLIDSMRMTGVAKPGDYDNRSMVMPQDFPSATFLRSRGIRDVLVIQKRLTPTGQDLDHVLLRWQQAGLTLWAMSADLDKRRELTVSEPSMFRKAWYRFRTLLGLRRNNVGGFGAIVPQPSQGGYG